MDLHLPGGVSGDETPEFLTTEVSRGAYDFVVIEQGTVESATNTELRCQVRSRGGGGGGGDRGSGGGGGGSSTTILDVVPEGTMVKEGDVVVELDSSSLVLEENSQKIQVSTRESQLAQAENSLKAAKIGRTEYLEGLFLSQQKLIMADLYIAEQQSRTADTVDYPAHLFGRHHYRLRGRTNDGHSILGAAAGDHLQE